MACVWEVHHYQVDRVLDNGEPFPEYKDDYEDYLLREINTPPILFKDRDGHLWSYDDKIISCNNAQKCGQNCELPVERHWVESEVPDCVQDSDERENSSKYEGEDNNKEEFEENSKAEGNLFVDELELEVENY
jgi:hypothetical protein